MASRKKQPTTARKRDGIHFVNARPSSETERLNAQRLVRAHVGRWISDQTKDRSNANAHVHAHAHAHAHALDTSSKSTRPTSRPVRNSLSSIAASSSNNPASLPPNTLVSRPSPPFAGPPIGPPPPVAFDDQPRREWQTSPFALSHASDSSDSSDDSTISVYSSEPAAVVPWEFPRVEPQITGVLDPFCTYPSRFSPDVINLCEQYCLSVLWPGLVPSRPGPGPRKKAGETWFPLSLSDPTLFTAFMFGALCHQRVQWLNRWVSESSFGPKQERILQLCEMESIKLINQAVRDPSRAISDAVLLSVICMAHHQSLKEQVQQHRKTPFNPPLQRLQWVDVYGCLPPNMIHIRGLIQLVKLRGGLKNIKLNGLPSTISFSDVFMSSVFCICPGFEFWPLDENRMGMSLQTMLGYEPADVERGFGRLQDLGITWQMAEAFQAAYTYINVVKTCLATSYDESLIADQRNLTQYTLLSLPPSTDLPTYYSHPNESATYEACRLAALIFAVGVIFPIPAPNTPLPRLATQLQAVLQLPSSSTLWTSPSTRIPLIWVLVLGGIAATNTPERPFFVSGLAETARRSDLSTWLDVKRVLEMMLWYDLACDEAGELLWMQAAGGPFVG